ncbi:MAG: [FeFe] hydrogenase H-cluster radical SAM maturase HydE [Candidatus Muiribacteriota bacterium]
MKLSTIKAKALNNQRLTRDEIYFLLKNLKNGQKKWIFQAGDEVRKKFAGEEIFLRGIIEFSNICIKKCNYCGINALNKKVKRYRMEKDEIINTCFEIEKNGQTTVVLQSGEDFYYDKLKMGEIIRDIKKKTNLAITLSVGEREGQEYLYWKDCGMDRYLLRFETSNQAVWNKLHPQQNFENRLKCIKYLKKIGVQTGSGFMTSLPGTTLKDLVEDIFLCRELELDMIGIGPFIPHPDTELKKAGVKHEIDFLTGVISILRLTNPLAHIPATTAFDTIEDYNGRQLALQRGANVFMPNATPKKYRKDYQLYPGKPCVDESGDDCANCVMGRIFSINRKIGKGPGHKLKL